ncbi:MAG: Rieske 2Fe-2S domain-containing protein [Burkholderiales bacterium]|nr:Rieske 2Fe-2S domain-containing protein [Burkholderiales bacterium]
MKSRMSAEAYQSEVWFLHERELLFKPLWQFVGLRSMLAQHNAYITRTVWGVSVVVQNFQGELRAFENLCLHRQNPLQIAPQGVRPLVCSYHGWGYGMDGGVSNIPFEAEVYRYPAEERQCLRLRRFALEEVGGLVFINLSDAPLPLTDQFSPDLLDSLRGVSLAFDGEVLQATFQTKMNWKLVYENLRDSHHPRYVHAQSLYQKVKFPVVLDEQGVAASQRLRQQGVQSREEALSLLRSFSNGGPDAPMEELVPYPWHDKVERYGDKDWYYNWLVFPNLHIASGSGGYSFIIEHHVPVSANRTDVVVHYVTAKKKSKYAVSAAVLLAHLQGAETVLREDFEVMERIQAGLHAQAPTAVLGDFESANQTIEHWYLDLMGARFAL